MNYLQVANNKIIGISVGCYYEKGINYPIEEVEVSGEIYNAYIEDKDKVIYSNGEIVLNPNYEADKAEKEKQDRILQIKNELNNIDLKSIRALRANDTEYIQRYETEALALREELHNLLN